MNRRQFIVTAGATTAVGLAGCLGGNGGGQGSPDGVVEAYYTASDAGEAEGYHHPDSPLQAEDPDADTDAIELTGTSVVAEDITSVDLEAEGISPNNLSDGDLDAIADEEGVALVEASVEIEIEGEQGVFDQPVITATDGGDWYILDLASEGFGF